MKLPPFPGRLLLRLVPLWLVFVVPLAVLKTGNDYVIQPKFAVCLAGALAAAAALTAAGRWRALAGQPLLVPLAAVCAAAAVAWPAAINRWQAAKLLVEQAGWAILCLAAVAEAPALGRVVLVAAASVAVQLWVAVLQIRGNWIVGHGEQFGAGRIYATLGNPSFFGVYLAPVAVILLCGVLLSWRAGTARRGARAVSSAVSACALVAVLFLMAKAAAIDAWAGLAVGGAAAVWLMVRDRVPRTRGALLALLVFVAGGAVTVTELAPRIWDRLDYLKVKAFSWHAAAWMWRDHAVLGAGPGEYQTQSPLVMSRVHALWTGGWGVSPGFVAPHDEAFAHEDYLQMLAETGVAGFGLWVWLLVIAVRLGVRDPARAPWVGALAAFAPTMALHFPLHLAPSLLLFWLCLGWSARGPLPLPPLEGEGRVRVVLPALAVAALLSALVFRGQVANVYLGEGYRLFRGGAPRLAVPHFQRFERLSPNDYEERFYAGALYQALKDDGAAIASYERALALYPGMQGAVYNLGNVHFNRGNYAEAARSWARALEINACNVDAANNLGNALALQGRYAEADRWYLRAVAIRPAHPDALYNLAVNAYRLDRLRDARRWLAKALAADPGYKPARELAATLGVRRP